MAAPGGMGSDINTILRRVDNRGPDGWLNKCMEPFHVKLNLAVQPPQVGTLKITKTLQLW